VSTVAELVSEEAKVNFERATGLPAASRAVTTTVAVSPSEIGPPPLGADAVIAAATCCTVAVVVPDAEPVAAVIVVLPSVVAVTTAHCEPSGRTPVAPTVATPVVPDVQARAWLGTGLLYASLVVATTVSAPRYEAMCIVVRAITTWVTAPATAVSAKVTVVSPVAVALTVCTPAVVPRRHSVGDA
jgi:hypothetical protein